MDVGSSINPAIDVGQIEGAYAQGLGWAALEDVVRGDAGRPWLAPGVTATRGPGAYKLPAADDVPPDLRVTLLRDAPCARTPAVASSKAVGEPPLFLGLTAWFALRAAVAAAREDGGRRDWFELDLPATAEALRLAAGDEVLAAAGVPEGARAALSV